jgi:hypothetical protein
MKIRDNKDSKEGYYQKKVDDFIKSEDEKPQKGKVFF